MLRRTFVVYSMGRTALLLKTSSGIQGSPAPTQIPVGRAHAHWTPNEINRLRLMLQQGETVDTIAVRTERPLGNVQQKIRKMGLMPTNYDRRYFERWTSKEESVLKQLANKGNSVRTIGEAIGRSTGGVGLRVRLLIRRGLLDRSILNPVYKKWTPEELEALLASSKMGIKLDDISQRMNRTLSAVTHQLRKLGVKSIRPVLWSPEKIDHLRDLRRQGKTYAEIAKAMQLTDTQVQNSVVRFASDITKPRYSPPRLYLLSRRHSFLRGRWTASEVDTMWRLLVEDRWCVDKVALKMQRTPEAVVAKARSFGISSYRFTNSGCQWSRRDEDLLRRCLRRGKSSATISLIFGVDPNAIKYHVLCIKPTRHVINQKELVQKMLQSGKSNSEIAAAIRVKPMTLRWLMSGWRMEDTSLNGKIESLHLSGVSVRDIAQRLDTSSLAVSKRLKRLISAPRENLKQRLSHTSQVETASFSSSSTPTGYWWRPEHDQQLLKLVRESHPIDRIAVKMNRTGYAIALRLRQLGHTYSKYTNEAEPWTAANHTELSLLLQDEGLSVSAAADKMGRSYTSVSCMGRQLQLRRHRDVVVRSPTTLVCGPWKAREISALRSAHGSGASLETIATTLRRSSLGIQEQLKRLKLTPLGSEGDFLPWLPSEDRMLAALLKQGKTRSQIAQLLKRSPRAVINRQYYLKL